MMVVVSRWYGGIQLGPDRFKHINNVARVLLQSSGLASQVQLHVVYMYTVLDKKGHISFIGNSFILLGILFTAACKQNA